MFLATHNYETERPRMVREEAVISSSVKHAPERRAARRVPVSLEALWDGMSGKREARVSDISRLGCFLETFGQASVGESINFFMKTPTERWLLLKGEVAYYQPAVGLGIRFTEISAQDEAMLRQLLEFYS